MLTIHRTLVVGLGGFIGANARYWLGMWITGKVGTSFPYHTLLINVTGCFILGMFSSLALALAWSDDSRLVVATGFVGAYTTFSTFEYETLRLFETGSYRAAFWNVLASVILGFGAAYIGVIAARGLMRVRI